MARSRTRLKPSGDQVAQTYQPLEILLSDQGSVDGTTTILDDLTRTYNGPHQVRRLQCPVVAPRGMPGLNEHINWAMTQTDADVIVSLSADDYDLAQRITAARCSKCRSRARRPSAVSRYSLRGIRFSNDLRQAR